MRREADASCRRKGYLALCLSFLVTLTVWWFVLSKFFLPPDRAGLALNTVLQLEGGRWDVDLVLAVCQEDVSFTKNLVGRLRSGGKTVRVHAYCKCGAAPASVRELNTTCTPIPNVGREFHTYFTHLAKHYYTLPPMLFFVNGGTASVAKAQLALPLAQKVADMIASADLPVWYADGHIQVVKPQLRRPADCRANAAFVRQAIRQCVNATACCTLCGSGCCTVFHGLCPESQSRVFDKQTTCSWRGGSDSNYGSRYRSELSPADPPIIGTWLCAHWKMNVTTFMDTGWALWGIFAVSADSAHSWPAYAYRRAARELKRSGMNGGVAVHYYERSARAIFSSQVQ